MKFRSLIRDGSGSEIATAMLDAQDVEQAMRVVWCFAARSGDVRVTSRVVQNPHVADYAKGGSPWVADFPSITGSVPRKLVGRFAVSATEVGQVVIDCGTVDVLDVWTGGWVTETVSAQLAFDVVGQAS